MRQVVWFLCRPSAGPESWGVMWSRGCRVYLFSTWTERALRDNLKNVQNILYANTLFNIFEIVFKKRLKLLKTTAVTLYPGWSIRVDAAGLDSVVDTLLMHWSLALTDPDRPARCSDSPIGRPGRLPVSLTDRTVSLTCCQTDRRPLGSPSPFLIVLVGAFKRNT